jgi:hypothetical protein
VEAMTKTVELSMSEKPTVSKESEIDLQLEDLIGKIVSGEATAADRYSYETLSRRRSLLMQPSVFRRLIEIRKRKTA